MLFQRVIHRTDNEIDDLDWRVLDPFTGTGTFIVRLLESGYIEQADLVRKYTTELHANEILLLAYYIAAVNIEAAFDRLDPGPYTPFDGIVLTDTFQLAENNESLDAVLFPENNKRVRRQKEQDIRVILGNPPYSVGQTNENDENKNQSYPAVDSRISATYAAESAATSVRSLYDSYIRAYRWASDRIKDSGIVCFVSNGGWIDTTSADGFRKSLANEFDHIYVFNLRGNQRNAGEESRREGGKIFGSGSRATVAITLLVRTGRDEPCDLKFHAVEDYLSREQKLALVDEATLSTLDWEPVTPNAEGDWLNQREASFDAFRPLATPARATATQPPIFGMYAPGPVTNRDSWCWNFSAMELAANTARLIENYNSEVASKGQGTAFTNDQSRVSWTHSLKNRANRGERLVHDPGRIVIGSYRPFTKANLYFDRALNERVYRQPQIFPDSGEGNVGIALTGPSSHFEFCCLMTDAVPDHHLLDTELFFPRFHYPKAAAESGSLFDDQHGGRVDNITDDVLADYQTTFGNAVSKDAIFHYVYGVLHSSEYRTRFGGTLGTAR